MDYLVLLYVDTVEEKWNTVSNSSSKLKDVFSAIRNSLKIAYFYALMVSSIKENIFQHPGVCMNADGV